MTKIRSFKRLLKRKRVQRLRKAATPQSTKRMMANTVRDYELEKLITHCLQQSEFKIFHIVNTDMTDFLLGKLRVDSSQKVRDVEDK